MKQLICSLVVACLSLLVVSTAQAITPIAACGFNTPAGGGAFELTGNLVNLGGDCITVDDSDVSIFMNGWTITCANGQGAGDRGITIGAVSNVSVHGPGTIADCDQGVDIASSSGVLVREMLFTGPVSAGVGLNPRPASQGIRVTGTVCPDPPETQVNLVDNEIENTRCGIALVSADCVNVHRNFTHDNNSDPVACFGILIRGDSDNNNIGHNVVTQNGENLAGDAGIRVSGTSNNNIIHNNAVNDNCGDGIFISSTGNKLVKNVATGNPTALLGPQCSVAFGFVDMRDTAAASANKWNKNNICNTSSGNATGACPP